MSPEAEEELSAINAIYGDDALTATSTAGDYILAAPSCPVTLRLRFPRSYPASSPPEVLGTASVGDGAPKGHGTRAVEAARAVLGRSFQPGAVCLFDLVQELEALLLLPPAGGADGDEEAAPAVAIEGGAQEQERQEQETTKTATTTAAAAAAISPAPPEWALSRTLTVQRSIFLAHATAITSPAHAGALLAALVASERRLQKATHNISAYRIRADRLVFQDCDDDGEAAAGGRLLHLLRAMDAWNVLVVVSRWYGGVKLGPDRFRAIGQVAREALVEGGWGRESGTGGRRRGKGEVNE